MSYQVPALDKQALLKNFNTAAGHYDRVSVLQKFTGREMLERLQPVLMKPATILDLGSGGGKLSRNLASQYPASRVIQADIALNMLIMSRQESGKRQAFICTDAEGLAFRQESVDLVFSNLMLQWCQDPGRAIAEVLGVLRPGGLFAFSSLGPDTLHELRESWAAADQATHVNTFVDMHDLGDALLHAGFADPVIDSDRVIMNYESVPGLMQDLRNLGAANVNQSRRKSLTGKGRLTKMLQAYETKRMGGKLPATYEVIYGHAWKPAGNTGHENGTFRISLDTLKETLGRFTSKKR